MSNKKRLLLYFFIDSQIGAEYNIKLQNQMQDFYLFNKINIIGHSLFDVTISFFNVNPFTME